MAGGGPASEAGRYRVALCDGGSRLHPGMLAASLNHLVARGALRRGTVIRVLEYFAGFSRTQRVIIVIQLEILHAECMLIRSPTIFEANASQHIGVSCSGGLAIHEPCFMPSQSTVEGKMQQLSLNDHQNQRFMKTATGLSGTMAAWLTPGAVVAVSEHSDGNGTLQPVLQVVDVRMVKNVENPSAECFRMVLSDGVYTMQSMLATAENMRVRDGSIQKGSIIHLQEFTCSTIQNRRIIIVIKLYVLQSECNIMGNPKPYEMRNQPNEQVTNFPANAAQANTGTYYSGPGMLGSSAAPRPVQDVNNVPYGGSYGGYQGMMGLPIGRAVESVPNVASGLSYGTTSAHNNTTNVGIVQSNLQQPSLNSHQNPRFAVPSMAGGSGAPGNTYGQPTQSFYQQSPPGHMNRTPVSKNDANHLVPVAQLNPYQKRWAIKARVTSKTDLRHYNNAKGAGKVFFFDLLDGQGGEIRARCFNAQADQFFDLMEVDKVYLISRGSLRPALKMFNSLNHEYEITLDLKTSIKVCVDDDSSFPRQ
ncbi:unnamed protein product [Miscanthus lutarioriparius]|uniref:Uncharacterized protein n=1 Tax=Miscanthus lutarioriparius TaxID=422564 RepID=A0A811S1Q1_9POAL|nr:unnamed protein product [Miscanthus lutarioriparius]